MSFSELLFLATLALLVFGPRRLPEIARIVGKTMGELRRASNEFKNSLEEEIRNLDYQESMKKAQSSLPEATQEDSATEHGEHSVATDPYALSASEEAGEHYGNEAYTTWEQPALEEAEHEGGSEGHPEAEAPHEAETVHPEKEPGR